LISTFPPVQNDEDLTAVVELFEAYAASLPIDLGYQDFSTELAALPGKCAPADELLLARDKQGEPLGCVGLRPIPQDKCCEMKRLFQLPSGLGLGRRMTEAVIKMA
jgi:hypothetical protein